jgi:ketosteroid isomerase-like protein
MTHAFLAALALVACLDPTSACPEDVRAAVEAGNRAFVAALLRGDARAVADLYTKEARVIAPGSDVVNGRPDIRLFWQKTIDAGVKDLTLSTGTVESAGDLAYEDGTVKLVGGDGKLTVGRYVVVWKREDGAWKLHRDIWN